MKLNPFSAVGILLMTVCSTDGIRKSDEVCYPPLGCFSTAPPFGISLQRKLIVKPKSPDDIGTVFKLYTRINPTVPVDLDARKVDTATATWPDFQAKPVKIIVHGFLQAVTPDDWLSAIKNELLIEGDYNVIIVDWSKGNKPPYTQATANTRVVGAQIALLIHKLVESSGIKNSDVHIIGHSLGSHIAGYAGERLDELGRITGLDPAGPQFENTDIRVRLDPSDAMFVDVIHTDGRPLLFLGFGTLQPMGHYDFYPNLGHDMPGCTMSNPLKDVSELEKMSSSDYVSCSHHRAVKYFIESINSKCPFTAYPCDGGRDFNAGKCNTCGTQGCARMGYHARPSGDHTIHSYYLTTSDTERFCLYHTDVSIQFSSKPTFSEQGNIVVSVATNSGHIKTSRVSDRSMTFKNDQTVQVTFTDRDDIGTITSVSLLWERDNSLSASIWNIFGSSSKRVYVNKVTTFSADADKSVSFCAADNAIEDKKTLLLTTNQLC
ncbi:pancreatic lipase-related protein 2 [Biomphalaria glabrata]|nr:pancreatic lipase-related protein 2 [Biomphalaria glabrata]